MVDQQGLSHTGLSSLSVQPIASPYLACPAGPTISSLSVQSIASPSLASPADPPISSLFVQPIASPAGPPIPSHSVQPITSPSVTSPDSVINVHTSPPYTVYMDKLLEPYTCTSISMPNTIQNHLILSTMTNMTTLAFHHAKRSPTPGEISEMNKSLFDVYPSIGSSDQDKVSFPYQFLSMLSTVSFC